MVDVASTAWCYCEYVTGQRGSKYGLIPMSGTLTNITSKDKRELKRISQLQVGSIYMLVQVTVDPLAMVVSTCLSKLAELFVLEYGHACPSAMCGRMRSGTWVHTVWP